MINKLEDAYKMVRQAVVEFVFHLAEAIPSRAMKCFIIYKHYVLLQDPHLFLARPKESVQVEKLWGCCRWLFLSKNPQKIKAFIIVPYPFHIFPYLSLC